MSLSPELRARMETPDAVANAMLVTQLKNVRGVNIDAPGEGENDLLNVEISLIREYQDLCEGSTAYSAYYLAENHSKLFDYITIIEGRPTPSELMRKRWKFHRYFLAKGKDKIWYAGSPSNYTTFDDPTNPLTTVYSSKDLEDVIQAIKAKDLGAWPTADEILGILYAEKYPSYRPPEITEHARGGSPWLKVFFIREAGALGATSEMKDQTAPLSRIWDRTPPPFWPLLPAV